MSRRRATAVGDSWYAERLAGVTPLDTVLPGWLRPGAGRSGIVRGFALAWAARGASTVVTTNAHPGTRVFLALERLRRRRRTVLLEYIVGAHGGSGVRPALVRAWRRQVVARTARRLQVLSRGELTWLPADHDLPEDRFRLVQWPTSFVDLPFPELTDRRRVVATGHTVDWETFLAAADGADWDTRVVCNGADLDRVAGRVARVRSDVTLDEHFEELQDADVYVLVLPETGGSVGQVRLQNAHDAGVPVVATRVTGVEGYVDHATTVLVPPGDPVALRTAVDDLLADPDRRDRLRRAAREHGVGMEDYLAELELLVADAG